MVPVRGHGLRRLKVPVRGHELLSQCDCSLHLVGIIPEWRPQEALESPLCVCVTVLVCDVTERLPPRINNAHLAKELPFCAVFKQAIIRPLCVDHLCQVPQLALLG